MLDRSLIMADTINASDLQGLDHQRFPEHQVPTVFSIPDQELQEASHA